MVQSNSDNRRVAKNSIYLYGRTFLTMIIGFYSSRVILQALGVDDFGLYNVVGGFVAMFNLVTDSLAAATQRFITVEIGKQEKGDINKVFGAVICIHIMMAIVFVFLLESIGLWFLNHKLNIPENSYYAANWVFQLSVLTGVVCIFSTPYYGVIVAHEKMKAFAYLGLFGSVAKLAIAFCILYFGGDKLILYASLSTLVTIITQFIIMRYCNKTIPDIHFWVNRDKTALKPMFSFAAIDFFGSFANVMSGQGVTIIINLFFGVAVNAARAITGQVQVFVNRFSIDFGMALSPQIMKEYAGGDKERSLDLCFRGAKFSFILMMIPMVPIFVRIESILKIWLVDYPEYTPQFVSLSLFISLFNILGHIFDSMINASGDIKLFTIWSSIIRLLVLPLVYVAFRFTHNPIYAYTVVLCTDMALILVKILISQHVSGLNILYKYLLTVVWKVVLVLALSLGIALLINKFYAYSIWGLILFGISTTLITAGLSVLIALTRGETKFISHAIIRKIPFLKSSTMDI